MDKQITLQNQHRTNGFVDHIRFESLTDEELIARILDGEIDLFEVILRRYNQKLYRIARSYVSDDEQAQEIIHRAYIKAYEHLDQFRKEAKFSTWLVRIAINEALTHLKKRKRYHKNGIAELNDNGHHRELVDEEDPEQRAVRADLKRLLEHVIENLPPKYRRVFVMREIEDMSTKETADCLDITRSNVKVRLHRAKKIMREELEKRVADIEVFGFKGARCDRMVGLVMDSVYDCIADNPGLAVRS